MKLYYSPGTCSLSPHIVLREAELTFSLERVDLKTHLTERGTALGAITSKDYVPVLELEDGSRLTEGPAIVQYLADLRPAAQLIPAPGTFERYRVQEWLNYITSELHKSFYPLFHSELPLEDWRTAARTKLARALDGLSNELQDRPFLCGERFTVADAYLFTVLNWTYLVKIELARWPVLENYVQRIVIRPKVQEALLAEGLIKQAA